MIIFAVSNFKGSEYTSDNTGIDSAGTGNPWGVFACASYNAVTAAGCSVVSARKQETLRLAAQSSEARTIHYQLPEAQVHPVEDQDHINHDALGNAAVLCNRRG